MQPQNITQAWFAQNPYQPPKTGAMSGSYVGPRDLPTAPVQQKKKGSFITNLLPTAGGIGGGVAGGAAGGALAGTAVLPGIGTAVGGLAGALLGGALGGAGGKVIENKVEGNALGDGVLGSGIEQGVFSAGPLRLLRGAKAVAGAAKPGVSLAEALANADTKIAAPGVATKLRSAIANKGAQTEARAGGYGIGEKLPGDKPLGFYDSAAINTNLKNEGIKPGAPEFRLKQVEDNLNQRISEIDKRLATSNVRLMPEDKRYIVDAYAKAIEKQPGIDDLGRRKAQELIDNFTKQTTDLKSVTAFRRGLDKQVINFNQNPDSTMAARQLAARTLRTVITDRLNKAIPGIKDLNKSYSNLIEAKEFLTGGAKAVSDQSQSANGGIIGRALSSDTAQGAKSMAGSYAQRLAPDGAPNPFGLTGQTLRQAPVGLGMAFMNSSGSQSDGTADSQLAAGGDQMTLAQEYANDPTNPRFLGVDPAQFGYPEDQTASANPYPKENLLADIRRDPAHQTQYIALYKQYADIFDKPDKAAGQLTVSQQTRAAAAQNALNDIPMLQAAISSGKLGGLKNIPGSGTAVGRRLLGTEDLDAALFNIADNILRARSGAAAPEAEVQRFKNTFLPGPLDSEEAKLSKLGRAVRELQGYVNPSQAAGGNTMGGGLTLQDALMQLQQ